MNPNSRSQTIDNAEDSAVKNTVIAMIPGNMNVLKFTPLLDGSMLDRPLPRMKRNSSGWTSEVTIRKRLRRKRRSSRCQTTTIADRSAPRPPSCAAAMRGGSAVALLLQLLGTPGGDQLAVVDDRNPVAVLGLVHVVRREEHRDPLAHAQLVDVTPDVTPGLWIEPDGRLVEEQNLPASASARARSPAAASFRPRTCAPDPVPALGQLHHLEHRIQPRGDLRARHPVKLSVEPEILLSSQILIQGRILEDQADPATHAERVTGNIEPSHARRTRRRRQQGAEDRDRRRLAGPIRPQEAERFARSDREAHAIDRWDLIESLDELLHLDDRHRLSELGRRGALGGSGNS